MSRLARRHFAPELLKAAQAEAQMGTEQMARRIGVSLRVVQKWRDGSVAPSGSNLIALAQVLGRSPESFYVEADTDLEPAA
jgi:DNA-binding transcriptional regulator YiaG